MPHGCPVYGTEGHSCPASQTTCGEPGERARAMTCPSCGQRLWFAPRNGLWPAHWVAPEGNPPPVVHRNDDATPEEARDASCRACAICDHEPDDPRCFDFCSSASAGEWLALEAAWACDNCGCPVVRAEVKLPHTGAWPAP